jgi:hypothetical protein
LRRWADVDPLAEREPPPTADEKDAEGQAAMRALQDFFDDPTVGDIVQLAGKTRRARQTRRVVRVKHRAALEHISEALPAQHRAELRRQLKGETSHSLIQRWFGRNAMLAEQARIVVEGILSTPDADLPKPRSALTKPGDPAQLRGIPVIGGHGSFGGGLAVALDDRTALLIPTDVVRSSSPVRLRLRACWVTQFRPGWSCSPRARPDG